MPCGRVSLDDAVACGSEHTSSYFLGVSSPREALRTLGWADRFLPGFLQKPTAHPELPLQGHRGLKERKWRRVVSWGPRGNGWHVPQSCAVERVLSQGYEIIGNDGKNVCSFYLSTYVHACVCVHLCVWVSPLSPFTFCLGSQIGHLCWWYLGVTQTPLGPAGAV